MLIFQNGLRKIQVRGLVFLIEEEICSSSLVAQQENVVYFWLTTLTLVRDVVFNRLPINLI